MTLRVPVGIREPRLSRSENVVREGLCPVGCGPLDPVNAEWVEAERQGEDFDLNLVYCGGCEWWWCAKGDDVFAVPDHHRQALWEPSEAPPPPSVHGSSSQDNES